MNAYYLILRKVLSKILFLFDDNEKVKSLILWPVTKRLLPNRKFIVDIGDGVKMMVYTGMQDMVNKVLLFYSGYRKYAWEPITSRIFEILIKSKKTPIVVVAGANIGYFAIIAAGFNKDAMIYGFEPVEDIYDKFNNNIKINNFNNIISINVGLSNSTGMSKINLSDGQSSLIDYERGDNLNTASIKTYKLDDYFNNHDKIPDLILLDVEGYEGYVLEGAVNILENKPDIIFEYNKRILSNIDNKINDALDRLKVNGYEIFIINDQYSQPHLRGRIDIELLSFNNDSVESFSSPHFNVLATKNIDIIKKYIK